MSNKRNLELYDQQAKTYAAAYRSLQTAEVLPHFTGRLAQISNPDSLTVLDLACGMGRDAAYIAELGFQVVAVDGSNAMLAEAKACNPHDRIEYVEDTGPAFQALRDRTQRYDIILVSAFIFHLNTAERKIFYQTLAALAAADCYLHLLIRHGPSNDARIMYNVPITEVEDFAQNHDFEMIKYPFSTDFLNRGNVSWQALDLIRGFKSDPAF